MPEKTSPMPATQKPLTREQNVWRWKILIATFMAYAGYYLTRKVFSLAKVPITSDLIIGGHTIQSLNLDPKQMAAHIWTAYLISYMIGQFLNSYIGRKWGPRVLLLGGLGLSIAINIVFGFTNSYWTFLVFMVFNGIAQASGWPGSVGGVAEWLRKDDRGTVMGVWSTSYLVGNLWTKNLSGFLMSPGVVTAITGSALFAFAAAVSPWRFAFFGCTLAAFAVWWLVFAWQRDRPQDVGLEPIVVESADSDRAVETSDDSKASFKQYMQLLFHPIIMLMGMGYFSIKFIRYALDSWEPTFLQDMGVSLPNSAFLSSIFDIVGIPGAILAGWVLDRVFRGRWDTLCIVMGAGVVVGYVGLTMTGGGLTMFGYEFQQNAIMFAIMCGFIGFMIYGPDTVLCGAASVHVAGEYNAVAVAGLVNGLGSIGPIFQEEIIGYMLKGKNGVLNVNVLCLCMSVVFVLTMMVVAWYVAAKKKKAAKHAA